MKDVMRSPLAKAAVRLALDEDLGCPWCDATSVALVDPKAVATGEIYSKGTGCVVAGATVAAAVLKAVDPKIQVKILKKDGSVVKPHETILTFRDGDAHAKVRRRDEALQDAHPRHAQDDAGTQGLREVCRHLRRRNEPPLRDVRPGAHEGQPPPALEGRESG